MSLATKGGTAAVSSKEGGPGMRTRMLVIGCLAATLAATGLGGGTAARADEEAKAPPDPTRGQWDAFLDPLRDFEDNYVTAGQKALEDTFETNDFDVQEAYLTWAMPDDGPSFLKGLSLKGGKFVTLLGAEVIEPWSNYNYSRSFLFSLAIPFTHTGALVSYPISDKLSVTGGAVEGWDKVQSNNQGWSGIGNVTYTLSDQVTLAANGIWGPEQTNKTGN